MVTKIQRWGNSLGLRLPQSFAKETNVREGSLVDIAVEKGQLVVRAVPAKSYSLRDLLKDVRPETIHGEVSTGIAVGRETF